jgi:hypothetical protein
LSNAHIRCSQRRILEEIAELGLLNITKVGRGGVRRGWYVEDILTKNQCLPNGLPKNISRHHPLPSFVVPNVEY